ncbi:MAG: Methylcobamide:CoM methyltransferase MtaA [Candidatus Methanofastidiosum methylothiophilum]|uniref:Methylcobamide:CoM methyltransferase MtaA n=1 Tax=Candidatus Methanofastidiosum methylothiophilum TaxID=1705564 RepID=A0A150IXM2_9EURY|nr:MAG: Methylcobamide:CoM methyltransferase MtaA [Candidatus Methanofastidiosum methylthiophilus]KYC46498.1 MAG: Methylcobamide:CoM methyltransferase MtaA [Candidatus Methanofastidiosum methylthiophilus]KYC49709.1 MAG: Methylcobamide:CoM methyltransferase MtaA [Candidatus Methanofastidiosum methylthiophilus]
MVGLTLKERLKRTLNGEKVDKAPVLAVTQTGTKDLMNLTKYYWPDANWNPYALAQLAISAHKEIGFEAVRIPYCLTVLLEALGCEIEKGDATRQAAIKGHPYNSRKPMPIGDVSGDILSKGRIPIMIEAIKIIRSTVGENVPIIAGAEGPVTIASGLVEVTTLMRWFIREKEGLANYLRYGTDAMISYANALIDAGADIFAVLDPVASPELINPRDFNEMILPIYKEISRKIKGDPILHICGDISAILPSLRESGFRGLSIEEKTDMKEAKDILGDKLKLIGNVSSANTLLYGTYNEVYQECITALEKGTDILAPGCGLAPMTPIKNCIAMIDARNNYFR